MDRSKIRTGVVIAVVFGAVGVATTVSFATLVFGENTPEHLNAGIAHFLLGGGVASVLLATISSLRGQFGGIQDVSAAIAGAIAASVAASLVGSSSEAVFANALVALSAATVLTGFFFIIMGRFRLGNFVRFVPFPVMAGFLAATGWLLFKGGLEVAGGGGHVEILQVGDFVDHARMNQVGLAIVFGITLYALSRMLKGQLWVLPGMLVTGITLFFVVVALVEPSLDQIRADHWLIGPLPDVPLWEALMIPDLGLVEWDALFGTVGSILTFVVVSALALLVTESALELAIERDIDVNDEMERSGVANVLAGITGAPASWAIIPSTAVAHSRGVLHPIFGGLHGALMLVAFVAGPGLISLFPRFVAGGLLVFIGFELIGEWVVDPRREMPVSDFAIVLAIVASVELLGFLPGVGVGLVASIVIFVVRYSSLQPIRDRLDGGAVHSPRDRPITDERLLEYHTDKLLILQLQGFIFFGSAYTVYRTVKEVVEDTERSPSHLLVDMRLVQGIDSSATSTFARMVKLLQDHDAKLVVVPGSDGVRSSLSKAGLDPARHDHLHVFERFDDAVEWCEERVLEQARAQLQSRGRGGADEAFLEAVFGDVMAGLEVQEEFESLVELLRDRMVIVDSPSGSTLFSQYDENQRLFFIVSGLVSLERVDIHGTPMRVRTVGPWNLLGEMGALLGYREPFTARIERSGEILALSPEALTSLVSDDPELDRRLQRLTIQMLGSELAKTTRGLTDA